MMVLQRCAVIDAVYSQSSEIQTKKLSTPIVHHTVRTLYVFVHSRSDVHINKTAIAKLSEVSCIEKILFVIWY